MCCSVTHIMHGCCKRSSQDSFLRTINFKTWNSSWPAHCRWHTGLVFSTIYMVSTVRTLKKKALPQIEHKSVATLWHGFFIKSFYNSTLNLYLTTLRPVEWRKPSMTSITISAELVHCTHSMLKVHPHYQQITMTIAAKIQYITSSSGNALL